MPSIALVIRLGRFENARAAPEAPINLRLFTLFMLRLAFWA